MHFLPISIAIFLIFLMVIPFLIFVLPAVAFAKLGLSPIAGLLFFFFCLVGSLINIPVYRKELDYSEDDENLSYFLERFFWVRAPRLREKIVAINVGGAILPGLLCLYLLGRVDPGSAALATALTTAFSYYLSRPVRGVGIVIPAFIPPIIAAVAALLFADRSSAPAVAYISGVLGTLIGADLLRIHQINRFRLSFLSIGGAGVFDGIFVVGIIAVLLA